STVDGVVSVHPKLANGDAAAADGSRVRHCDGIRFVVCLTERKVSGLSIHRAVCGAIWNLRFSSWVLEQHSSREVAATVFAQPDGWGDRWIPLGDYRRRSRALHSRLNNFDLFHNDVVFVRTLVFPTD